MADPETQFVPDAPLSTDTQHVADLPVFGRLRTVAQLGAGAAGIVYRAEDDVLGRAVAVKLLHAQADRERFLREARTIAAFLHENIISIYDIGTLGELPYFVMELAQSTLRERMRAGLTVETVRQVGIQIARALATAHAAGIVHRDVKPANILAAFDGRWKLADFGIARPPDSTMTTFGQFLGSPAYAAPESLRAGVFGAGSDVYALATTLYEAIAGAPPYPDDWRAKLAADPPPLANAPPDLAAAIAAGLARDPAKRPRAAELQQRLAAG